MCERNNTQTQSETTACVCVKEMIQSEAGAASQCMRE